MCTVVLSVPSEPSGAWFLAANRDEWKARPTLPFGVLDASYGIFGGRDAVAQGTWSAYRPSDHQFAIVLNARPGSRPNPELKSRGDLPLLMLRAGDFTAMKKAAASLAASAYNPFWLLFGSAHRWALCGSDQAEVCELLPGLHVVSNHGLDVADDAKWEAVQKAAPVAPSLDLEDKLRTLLKSPPIHVDFGEYGTRWSQLFVHDQVQATPSLLIAENGERAAPAVRILVPHTSLT